MPTTTTATKSAAILARMQRTDAGIDAAKAKLTELADSRAQLARDMCALVGPAEAARRLGLSPQRLRVLRMRYRGPGPDSGSGG
jgi:hypothetical protein